VVLLSTLNAVIWIYYTESNLMGIIWAGIAGAFLIWIADDVRRL
jgi:hypothetical protein